MRRIAFRIPKRQERAIIIVDDADAARFKVEYWLARINNSSGYVEIYKSAYGVMTMLGRELLGITEDGVCVIHKNDDPTDFRRSNLMAVSRATFQKIAGLILMPRVKPKQEYCKRGHLLDDDNRMSNGKCATICRKCSLMRSKRSYQIRKSLAKTKPRHSGLQA